MRRSARAPAGRARSRRGRRRRRTSGSRARGSAYLLARRRIIDGTGGAMQLTRNTLETAVGPADWFTGAVFIDTVAEPSGPYRVGSAHVHFTPGARTAWHTHPNGQTIWVTEGVGLCQREGGAIEVIRPGDRVFFEPGENHWHGAAPTRFMAHVAIHQADEDGSTVSWGENVSDEAYAASPTVA